jgi:hypothetical protein
LAARPRARKCAAWPMREDTFRPIILVVEEDVKTAAGEAAHVAICGDPIVGRALALVRSAHYEARLVPVDASGEPGPLGDARVVVLTPAPGLSSGRREALITTLWERAAAAGTPVLELTAFSEGMRARPAHGMVPWPCSTKELERRIEVALSAAGARQEGERAWAGERRHS